MLIAIGFLFFGACSLWYGRVLHKSRKKVAGWSRITGRITHREVSLSTRAGLTSSPAFRYEALVTYDFVVGGKTYSGDKLYPLGWVTSSSKNRKKFLDKIPDEPSICYDPQNPSDSCLFLPNPVWIALGYGIGAVLVLLGFCWLLPVILGLDLVR